MPHDEEPVQHEEPLTHNDDRDETISPFEGLLNPDEGENTPASDADAPAPFG